MPSDSPELDMILSALANGKRRGIIDVLSLHPETISSLAREQGLSLPAMHKHMLVLEKAHLIMRKQSGRTHFVALNVRALQVVQDWMKQFHSAWGSEKASLDNYIYQMHKRV